MTTRRAWTSAALLAIAAMSACKKETPPQEQVVVWPEGDAARGRQTFVDLGCSSCHEVSGSDLPKPSADPPVPIVLAGARSRDRTTAQLITAIINPSHEIAPSVREDLVKSGSKSRMGDYSHVMTVGQLVDVVEFLGTVHGWSTYGDEPPPGRANGS